jgi:hypothetical protein
MRLSSSTIADGLVRLTAESSGSATFAPPMARCTGPTPMTLMPFVAYACEIKARTRQKLTINRLTPDKSLIPQFIDKLVAFSKRALNIRTLTTHPHLKSPIEYSSTNGGVRNPSRHLVLPQGWNNPFFLQIIRLFYSDN